MEVNTKTRSQNLSGRVFHRIIRKIVGNKVDSYSIVVVSLIVSFLMILPAIFIVVNALGSDINVWPKLWTTKIPLLLSSTLSLTISVTLLTIVIAVSAALLVSMTDLPGKRTWQWLLALPLAIPPYIGSFAYIALFGPRGLLQKQLSQVLNVGPSDLSMPSIYSFGGALLIMSTFTYPYIFLLVSAALKSQNQSLIDAARASGMKLWQVLLKVTLPLIRPSIIAGSLLVALYVLSDFGAISLLRYPTFTSAIYQQLTGRYDLGAAAALSTVLMAITVGVLWFEWRSRLKARFYQTTGTNRPATIIKLGKLKWPALIFVIIIIIFALILPTSVLVYWSVLGVKEGIVDFKFFNFVFNSLSSSAIAATVSSVLALPVVYMFSRYPSILSQLIWRISFAGYALPGVLVGLGMVFIFNSALPFLYGTVFMLIIAYVVRFLPQSLQSQEAALGTITPNLEEAAKSFGFKIFSIFKKITIPLMLPSIKAGWALIFISCMKELPATLLLRPAGFDTLAVRVWIDASEGFFTLAAPSALLLVLVSAVPLAIITYRRGAGKSNKAIGSLEDVSSSAG